MRDLIKTNLRWAGGKSRMTDILETYMPSKIEKYLETFLGGGSVLLHVLQRFNPKLVYANDIDSNLVNYYSEVQQHPQQLIQELTLMKSKFNEEEFREEFTKLDRSTAVGFYAANKSSFSGLNYNYSESSYVRNFTLNSIDAIGKISHVIRDVNLVNSNYLELDRNLAIPIRGFFIYLDPPYYGNRKVGLYGRKGELHKGFDHEALHSWVEQHSADNQIMISYDDSPYIRELYKDYNIYDFSITYTMTNTGGNKGKTGGEIVITNYDIIGEPQLF